MIDKNALKAKNILIDLITGFETAIAPFHQTIQKLANICHKAEKSVLKVKPGFQIGAKL